MLTYPSDLQYVIFYVRIDENVEIDQELR